MFFHVIGWVTMAWILVTGVGTARWAWVAGRETRTWLHAVPVPKLIDAPLELPSGSDCVGLI